MINKLIIIITTFTNIFFIDFIYSQYNRDEKAELFIFMKFLEL